MTAFSGPPQVLPSVMSADMLALGDQLDDLLAAGMRTVHVDVMDAHFVPNLTVGVDWTAAVAERVHEAGGFVDVHLMVDRPAEMVRAFAPSADAISVHLEADPHPHRRLGEIRDLGCAAGLAINPGTAVEAVGPLAGDVDFVNVLAVDPGFAGQSFIEATPARVERLVRLLPDGVPVEVDGGVGPSTLPAVRDAGARLFVSASAVFAAPDPVSAFREMADAAER